MEVIVTVSNFIKVTSTKGEFVLTTPTGDETYEYLLLAEARANNSISSKFQFLASDSFISYGAKTEDINLDDVTLENLSNFIEGEKTTTASGGVLNENYSELVSDILSSSQTERTVKVKHGVASHLHEKGVRAFRYKLKQGNMTTVEITCVIRNKANGKALPKTDKQTWTVEHTYGVSAWED